MIATKYKRQQAFTLEMNFSEAECIKSISDCLFMNLYISIDARTQLFRGFFIRL